MSEIVEIVDSLENKISKLLHKMELLHLSKAQLEADLVSMQKQQEELRHSVLGWEQKYNSLKLASSMLGSNEDKTEAKLKINTLIRELDHCIMQLSE
ncbi:hypothetical protein U1E44_07615 [Arenibacter sp. GZD96]|uniref:hypothetical protein n=1 Tax=Aurantibrevibacter litoralis TaxID=3106030 RepID=UPI002AFF7023|nr:hypothetical protein [Arenibacter sp. GZD-96]MEA1785954.1 hypothetical protein [Arenibacter sp. GZD-96]